MALYTATNLPSDGETIEAADVNTDMQGLIDEFNGSIDNDNISASAAIAKTKLQETMLGYAEVTANQATMTGTTDLTGLAVTVTVPSGGRKVKITGYGKIQGSTANTNGNFQIKEGATVLNGCFFQDISGNGQTLVVKAVLPAATATAGAHTYKLTWAHGSGGSMSLLAAATTPAFILVELI